MKDFNKEIEDSIRRGHAWIDEMYFNIMERRFTQFMFKQYGMLYTKHNGKYIRVGQKKDFLEI